MNTKTTCPAFDMNVARGIMSALFHIASLRGNDTLKYAVYGVTADIEAYSDWMGSEREEDQDFAASCLINAAARMREIRRDAEGDRTFFPHNVMRLVRAVDDFLQCEVEAFGTFREVFA